MKASNDTHFIKPQIMMILLVLCMVLERPSIGAPADELIKAIEGNWVDWTQTNTSLSITSTNLTIFTGDTRELWVFVPSTNRFDVFASRNGLTNRVFFAEGGACEKVVFLGNRRWFVNRGQAGPANGSLPFRPETNRPPSTAGSRR